MPRGKKICPKCSKETGPRAHFCTGCGHKYQFAPKTFSPNRVVKSKFNWRDLEPGEYIKSIGSSGPFYPTKDDNGQLVPIHMGHYGIFKVAEVKDDGILAKEVRKGRVNGYCFLYMGKTKMSKVTGTVMRPHKIKKVVRKERK